MLGRNKKQSGRLTNNENNRGYYRLSKPDPISHQKKSHFPYQFLDLARVARSMVSANQASSNRPLASKKLCRYFLDQNANKIHFEFAYYSFFPFSFGIDHFTVVGYSKYPSLWVNVRLRLTLF